MSSASVREQKALLRKRVGEQLERLSTDEIDRQSAAVTRHVLHMPAYQRATSMAIFLSMPGREVSTRAIVLQALADGKDVFVPYLYRGALPKSKTMAMLQLRDQADFQSLQPDAWNIPSLAPDSIGHRRNALGGLGISHDPATGPDGLPRLDLIFVPAVAFDRSLRRLGHGRGFYDRYFQSYRNTIDAAAAGRQMPHLIGLGLVQQLLPPGQEIPVTDDDWKVDQVVVADTDTPADGPRPS